MAPAESLEIAELVADLTAVIDSITPHAANGAAEDSADAVGVALAAFGQAWTPTADAERLTELSLRVAAAGMALVEGDPRTVRRLIAPAAGAAEAA